MHVRDERRRTIYSNAPLQKRIILSITWMPLIFLSVCALVLAGFCVHLSNVALQADVDLPSIVPVFLALACFLVITCGYLVFNALKVSHQVAGPMTRIKQTLAAVRQGNLACRAKLRPGDFLMPVADDLNEFLDWLAQHPPAGPAANETREPEAAEPVGETSSPVEPG